MDLTSCSCSLCLSPYNQTDRLPRIIISCGDTLCTVCIFRLLGPKNSFECPFDKIKSFIYKRGIETFPPNAAVIKLMENKTNVEVISEEEEEVQENGELCGEHGEEMRFFCMEDKCLVCEECLQSSHNEHYVKSLKKMKLDDVRRDEELTEKGEGNNEISNEVDQQKVEVMKEVKRKFEKLVPMLEKKENDLIREIEKVLEVQKQRVYDDDHSYELKRRIAERMSQLDDIIEYEDFSKLEEEGVKEGKCEEVKQKHREGFKCTLTSVSDSIKKSLDEKTRLISSIGISVIKESPLRLSTKSESEDGYEYGIPKQANYSKACSETNGIEIDQEENVENMEENNVLPTEELDQHKEVEIKSTSDSVNRSLMIESNFNLEDKKECENPDEVEKSEGPSQENCVAQQHERFMELEEHNIQHIIKEKQVETQEHKEILSNNITEIVNKAPTIENIEDFDQKKGLEQHNEHLKLTEFEDLQYNLKKIKKLKQRSNKILTHNGSDAIIQPIGELTKIFDSIKKPSLVQSPFHFKLKNKELKKTSEMKDAPQQLWSEEDDIQYCLKKMKIQWQESDKSLPNNIPALNNKPLLTNEEIEDIQETYSEQDLHSKSDVDPENTNGISEDESDEHSQTIKKTQRHEEFKDFEEDNIQYRLKKIQQSPEKNKSCSPQISEAINKPIFKIRNMPDSIDKSPATEPSDLEVKKEYENLDKAIKYKGSSETNSDHFVKYEVQNQSRGNNQFLLNNIMDTIDKLLTIKKMEDTDEESQEQESYQLDVDPENMDENLKDEPEDYLNKNEAMESEDCSQTENKTIRREEFQEFEGNNEIQDRLKKVRQLEKNKGLHNNNSDSFTPLQTQLKIISNPESPENEENTDLDVKKEPENPKEAIKSESCSQTNSVSRQNENFMEFEKDSIRYSLKKMQKQWSPEKNRSSPKSISDTSIKPVIVEKSVLDSINKAPTIHSTCESKTKNNELFMEFEEDDIEYSLKKRQKQGPERKKILSKKVSDMLDKLFFDEKIEDIPDEIQHPEQGLDCESGRSPRNEPENCLRVIPDKDLDEADEPIKHEEAPQMDYITPSPENRMEIEDPEQQENEQILSNNIPDAIVKSLAEDLEAIDDNKGPSEQGIYDEFGIDPQVLEEYMNRDWVSDPESYLKDLDNASESENFSNLNNNLQQNKGFMEFEEDKTQCNLRQRDNDQILSSTMQGTILKSLVEDLDAIDNKESSESKSEGELSEYQDSESEDGFKIHQFFQIKKRSYGTMIRVVSTGNRKGKRKEEFTDLKELKYENNVSLKIETAYLSDESTKKLWEIWENLENMTNFCLFCHPKYASDAEFMSFIPILYARGSQLMRLEINFENCQVGDDSLTLLFKCLSSQLYNLTALSLNLEGTNITEKTVDMFVLALAELADNLEEFELNISGTKLGNWSILKLFVEMPKLKKFVFNAADTLLCNMCLVPLAEKTLRFVQNLEYFELGLSETHVTDEGLGFLTCHAGKMKTFKLDLRQNKGVTDAGMREITKEILRPIRALESLEVLLSGTRSTGNWIYLMDDHLWGLKRIKIDLRNTWAKDQFVFILAKRWPKMIALEDVEFYLGATMVSDRSLAKLFRDMQFQIEGLRSLYLDLNGTGVSNVGLAEFLGKKEKIMREDYEYVEMDLEGTRVGEDVKMQIQNMRKRRVKGKKSIR